MAEQSNSWEKIREVAGVFFKLGCFAFGGPAAHIAMMEAEIVERRKWMDRQHFLDLIGATNLIPGPNSTEMTMHCGYERAGVPGLVIAGLSFLFPAVVLTGLLAFLYVEYGTMPEVAPLMDGIKPAVLVLIAGAVYKLGKKALKNTELGILGGLVMVLALLGYNEILVLLGAGLLGMIYFILRYGEKGKVKQVFPFILLQVPSGLVTGLTSLKIFWIFLKVGAILYGSGYVLFAYLDAALVAEGLLTRPELMDAIAIGQFTPGPVLSTATFIGYQLGGFGGALAATLGIFLPAFLLVGLLNPFVPMMRKSKVLSYFLDTVNIAAVGIMAAVLIEMGLTVLQNWQSILILFLCTYLFFFTKYRNPIIIILLGALLGLFMTRFSFLLIIFWRLIE